DVVNCSRLRGDRVRLGHCADGGYKQSAENCCRCLPYAFHNFPTPIFLGRLPFPCTWMRRRAATFPETRAPLLFCGTIVRLICARGCCWLHVGTYDSFCE